VGKFSLEGISHSFGKKGTGRNERGGRSEQGTVEAGGVEKGRDITPVVDNTPPVLAW
jgi:hypothetical protein